MRLLHPSFRAIIGVACLVGAAHPVVVASPLLRPAAQGYIQHWPELAIPDLAQPGGPVQSKYFRTLDVNREFRRGVMEFAIPAPAEGTVRSATLFLFERGSASNHPRPVDVHVVHAYGPADLEVSVEDYARPGHAVGTFVQDPNLGIEIFQVDVTGDVRANQGANLGFRVQMQADPDLLEMGKRGNGFSEPHLRLAFDDRLTAIATATGSVRRVSESLVPLVEADYVSTEVIPAGGYPGIYHGMAEFAIPEIRGAVRRARLVIEKLDYASGDPASPEEHRVIAYPDADLRIDVDDYERAGEEIGRFQAGINDYPSRPIGIDVTSIVNRNRGRNVGFRFELASPYPDSYHGIVFGGFASDRVPWIEIETNGKFDVAGGMRVGAQRFAVSMADRGLHRVQYELPLASTVHLDVFDVSGRLVRSLVEGPETPGLHAVVWDPSRLPSGLLLYRLQSVNGTSSAKLMHVH